jgi:hypothetical protein
MAGGDSRFKVYHIAVDFEPSIFELSWLAEKRPDVLFGQCLEEGAHSIHKGLAPAQITES